MNELEIEALVEHNAQQLNKLNVAAAGVVSALLTELERAGRKTYIRLDKAVRKGHRVNYQFVKGDRSLVKRIGRALGFAVVTDDTLEVHHG